MFLSMGIEQKEANNIDFMAAPLCKLPNGTASLVCPVSHLLRLRENIGSTHTSWV